MPSLFDPIQLGAVSLRNRIVMAPMTRTRASAGRVPNDLMRLYYSQRASAGLILSEATSVSPQGVGYPNTPGIWSSAQVDGWRKVTSAVHEKGGKIFVQLWHVGRVSDPEHLNGEIPVAPSAIACSGHVSLLRPKRNYVVPRALHAEEIPHIVQDFADAAGHARDAGFDGIEIHAANGYLIDQFLQDGTNKRQDGYGGSIENRARFLMEIVDACSGVWGAGRIGVHLSPYGTAHDIHDSNPEALFGHVARELSDRGVGFLFIREAPGREALTAQLREDFDGSIIVNQDYDRESAERVLIEGRADAVAFGRPFISNPDLVQRLKKGMEQREWDATTFYGEGPTGYVDYSCCACTDTPALNEV
ncbi:MAG TPA: alkene reductase [Burkholderiaceae bacterium]|jgi:2,4-dienoyl-CoA reductase-like NADH-dependent reductase (Old Yellow Enzyme family)|nr:alkene reductase [Burkholderiaceae bacterium]